MKMSKKIVLVVAFVLAICLVAPNVYAGAVWSQKVKVVHFQTGSWATYVYADRAFPNKKTVARILKTADGHSRMLATIMASMSMDKFVMLAFDNDGAGNVVQVLLSK